MKKVITLLFTFIILFILFNCPTEPMDDPRFRDGTVTFYPNGKIERGILNDNYTIDNIRASLKKKKNVLKFKHGYQKK